MTFPWEKIIWRCLGKLHEEYTKSIVHSLDVLMLYQVLTYFSYNWGAYENLLKNEFYFMSGIRLKARQLPRHYQTPDHFMERYTLLATANFERS